MANVETFVISKKDTPIPPDGEWYDAIGPNPAFGSGAITVTVIPRNGSGVAAMYMQVTQMATRTYESIGGVTYYLDVVVRNNSHVGHPEASTITAFDIYISVVN